MWTEFPFCPPSSIWWICFYQHVINISYRNCHLEFNLCSFTETTEKHLGKSDLHYNKYHMPRACRLVKPQESAWRRPENRTAWKRGQRCFLAAHVEIWNQTVIHLHHFSFWDFKRHMEKNQAGVWMQLHSFNTDHGPGMVLHASYRNFFVFSHLNKEGTREWVPQEVISLSS